MHPKEYDGDFYLPPAVLIRPHHRKPSSSIMSHSADESTGSKIPVRDLVVELLVEEDDKGDLEAGSLEGIDIVDVIDHEVKERKGARVTTRGD